jgi:hypothetical protein
MEKVVVNKSLQVDQSIFFLQRANIYFYLVARTCNLIFIVLDVLKPLGHKRLIEHELEGFGIRLNKEPPNIYFKRKDKGGLNYQALVPQTTLDLDTVKAILGEYKIHNAVSEKQSKDFIRHYYFFRIFSYVVMQQKMILSI